MKYLLLVILGGGIGSGLRYLISKHLNPVLPGFYLGTFAVNILGCLLMGIILGATFRNQSAHPALAAFLAAGFCGGFTTFSAFSLEQFALLREGHYLPFITYSVSSLVVGVLAVVFGVWVSRLF